MDDDDGYSPQSILTSKCKQIVKVHKHKGWGQNKRAEGCFSLIETAGKIPGNSRDTCPHRYSTLRGNTIMHTHKQLKISIKEPSSVTLGQPVCHSV